MGIYNANRFIREARQKAGLTQEQMSEGICSSKVLSRIETGLTNVSHNTFRALTERAGISCSAFPAFESREGFRCFYALQHARFHLDAWQLDPAWDALQRPPGFNWAGNRLYYQEWLLLHCQLQSYSCLCSHRQNFETLLHALHITRPEINLSDFRSLLLSPNEIRLLTALAREALYLGRMQDCLQIHEQVAGYLADSIRPLTEKERLQADDAIVYTKYLIASGDHASALETARNFRRKMALNGETAPLLELTFLTGLCCYHTGKGAEAEKYVKAAFYSACALGSCYAAACRDYLRRETSFPLTGGMLSCPVVPPREYPCVGTAHAFSPNPDTDKATAPGAYPLGSLIHDLRREQKLSQSLLCQGLCTASRLSKIENGAIQPDIMLSEALLQRLGLWDRVFTFWGNERETRFHDLKYKIMYERLLPPETLDACLAEMERLADGKDILYFQEYLLLKTTGQNPPGQRTVELTQALHLTLPEFKINDICSYRLTWCELTILNNLAHEYRLTGQTYLCSLYSSQITAYMETAEPDLLLRGNILPFTYFAHCRTLFLQGLYRQTLDFADTTDISLLKYNLTAYTGYLFFYSQALGRCGSLRHAASNAVSACALSDLREKSGKCCTVKRIPERRL